MSYPPRWNESYESDADRRRDRRRGSEDPRFDRDRDQNRDRDERSFESQQRGGRGRRDDDAFDAPGGFAERDRWDLYEEWQQPRRMGGYYESQRFGSQGGFPADRGARDFQQQRERSTQPQDWQRGQRYPAYEGQQRFGAQQGFGESQEQGRFAGRGPKNYKRSDQRIQEDICDRLTSDPHIDASEIQVDVKGGEVTLEGTVSERGMKRRAEDCIEDVSGVSQVHNRLRIGSQQTQGQQEASWARAGSEQQRADQPSSSQSRTGRIA
jgi:osmotically-inducible protein OsmY